MEDRRSPSRGTGLPGEPGEQGGESGGCREEGGPPRGRREEEGNASRSADRRREAAATREEPGPLEIPSGFDAPGEKERRDPGELHEERGDGGEGLHATIVYPPRAREEERMGEISRVAVLGAGTMGSGIAQTAAAAGYEVVLHDAIPEGLERGIAAIRRSLDRLVEKGKIDAAAREKTLAGLRTARSLEEAVEAADLVVEAVPEVLELKRRLFGSVDRAAPEGAILATNTSSLPVGKIAEATRRPARVLGMHFFNPVPVMPLLEIVRADRTGDEAVASAVAVARRMGKEPIVVRDVPGFATSRLGVLLGLEAMRMLEEGVASAEDIDKAMTLGYRHPMGPLRLTDLVGLDVRLAIAEHLHEALGSEAFRPPEILKKAVEEGRLGKKSGRGFFEWPSE